MNRDQELSKLSVRMLAINDEVEDRKKQIYKLKDEIETLKDEKSLLQDKFNLKVMENL